MSFAHPWLLGVTVLAAAAFLFVYRAFAAKRMETAMRYSNLEFLVGAIARRTWLETALLTSSTAAVALVLFGAAGPHVRALVPVRDGSVVLCIDTSGSMATTDVAPTRADAAVAAMRALIARTPAGTRIGIVAFSGAAEVIVPPTRDRAQVETGLQAVPPPNGATAIGDALALSERVLPKTGKRVVVLITDGESNAGSDPMQAAQSLGGKHILLYTIGIGTNSGAFVPGTLQEAGIDEEALRAYAAATGGAYSRADDANQLRGVLARLGRTIAFERGTLDISLTSALAGGALLAATILAGAAAGRFP